MKSAYYNYVSLVQLVTDWRDCPLHCHHFSYLLIHEHLYLHPNQPSLQQGTPQTHHPPRGDPNLPAAFSLPSEPTTSQMSTVSWKPHSSSAAAATIFFLVLRTEPWLLYMIGMCCTTKPYPQPEYYYKCLSYNVTILHTNPQRQDRINIFSILKVLSINKSSSNIFQKS